MTNMLYDGNYEAYTWHKTSPAPSAPINTNDTDQDGVIDAWDNCPNTPPGTLTDKHGCAGPSNSRDTLSSTLNIHIPNLQLNNGSERIDLWVDFEYAGENNGDYLWKLVDFGVN